MRTSLNWLCQYSSMNAFKCNSMSLAFLPYHFCRILFFRRLFPSLSPSCSICLARKGENLTNAFSTAAQLFNRAIKLRWKRAVHMHRSPFTVLFLSVLCMSTAYARADCLTKIRFFILYRLSTFLCDLLCMRVKCLKHTEKKKSSWFWFYVFHSLLFCLWLRAADLPHQCGSLIRSFSISFPLYFFSVFICFIRLPHPIFFLYFGASLVYFSPLFVFPRTILLVCKQARTCGDAWMYNCCCFK